MATGSSRQRWKYGYILIVRTHLSDVSQLTAVLRYVVRVRNLCDMCTTNARTSLGQIGVFDLGETAIQVFFGKMMAARAEVSVGC